MNMAVSEQQLQETLQAWVYRQLREAIMTGYFIPGRSVTLRGVAAELNVSPMPVREALQRLVAERALTAIDGQCLELLRRLNADIDAAVTAGHVDGYLQKQRLFHFTLYNAAPSQVLSRRISVTA